MSVRKWATVPVNSHRDTTRIEQYQRKIKAKSILGKCPMQGI